MTDRLNEETCSQILRVIPFRIKNIMRLALSKTDGIREIVIRCDMPVCIYTQNGLLYLTANGCTTYRTDSQPLVITDANEVTECFNMVCDYSVYSHMNEIKEGFVTIKGGHRVGICGTAVVSSSVITNIRDISTVSLRVCRQVLGCADELATHIDDSSGGVIICGAPCSGKTTVLRDLARTLSIKEQRRISLIDTRGELASVYRGVPQLDVGFCDVLNNYPRAQGIAQAIKVFSPEFVLCDEIGTEEDYSAILSGINSGVRFISTAHCKDFDEFLQKSYMKSLLSSGAFEKIVFLKGRDNPGKVESVVEIRDGNYV